MDRWLAIGATLAVGAIIAFQPPVNSQLARHTSLLGAAFVSTAVSALVLGVLFFASGRGAELAQLDSIPVLYLTGGLAGAALVTVSLVTVRTLGAGGVVAATVCTQLVVSAILDRLGVLGLEGAPLSSARIVGFVLLLVGTAIVTLNG